MSLKTAKEDLAGTLDALAGTLTRREYLAGLLNADGAYLHWGMDRRHGAQAAQKALAEAHQALVARVLRTSLEQLLVEVESVSAPRGLTPSAYLEQLLRNVEHLLPVQQSTGARRHLGSALHALSSLTRQSE